MKTVTMPSRARLDISLCPFKEAKALYQAVLEEAKVTEIKEGGEVADVIKTFMCGTMSSKKVDAALEICMSRALYNGSKIDDSTFEPEEARQDYVQACVEVALYNVGPFMKGLYAQYAPLLGIMESPQK